MLNHKGTYNVSNQIKFKTSMIRLNLRNYSDASIQIKETITVRNTRTEAANNSNKKLYLKIVLHILIV